MELMIQAPKDTRSGAEKARDTAGIIGSLKHEAMVQTPRMKPFINEPCEARSPAKKPSQFFANAPLSRSERRALLPTMGGIVTEPKTPLDERALDALTDVDYRRSRRLVPGTSSKATGRAKGTRQSAASGFCAHANRRGRRNCLARPMSQQSFPVAGCSALPRCAGHGPTRLASQWCLPDRQTGKSDLIMYKSVLYKYTVSLPQGK